MAENKRKAEADPQPDEQESFAAIAFDIDGVFKYGRHWSADGLGALQRCTEAGLPFLFVTNGGGGLTEATYAAQFTQKVTSAAKEGTPAAPVPSINEHCMILSYSPWRESLAPDLVDKRVLLIGDPKEKVLDVAKSYGLTRVTHYEEYATMHATINPFRQARLAGTSHTAVANTSTATDSDLSEKDLADNDPFCSILVMCDPYSWFEALQVCVDVLCSPRPIQVEYDAGAPPIPVHFSNPDVLWKTQHPWARFGQGAFKIALRALYITRLRSLRVPEETHDERVAASFKQWGKPTDATFRFLETRLRTLAPGGSALSKVERFYMVGDNPASDMEGVRRANIFHRSSRSTERKTGWTGVLVKTGVFKEGDETNLAETAVDGVSEAVDYILAKEGKA